MAETRHPPDRLIVFGDHGINFAGMLLDAFATEASRREDVQLVAVCDTALKPLPNRAIDSFSRRLRGAAMRFFNAGHPGPPSENLLIRAASRHRLSLVAPPERNINHPRFLQTVREEFRANLALSVGCLQIFKPELLDCFQMAVNFHDGLLPDYKGRGATAWSLYRRESSSGYTFHRMDAGIDTGPMLRQGSILLQHGMIASEAAIAKVALATQDAGRVLDLMRERAAGTPQTESGSSFSARDRRLIVRIEAPSALSADELLHRLRAFPILTLQIAGRWYRVTALEECSGAPALSFATSDGRRLVPTRCMFLPPWLHRLYRIMKRALGSLRHLSSQG